MNRGPERVGGLVPSDVQPEPVRAPPGPCRPAVMPVPTIAPTRLEPPVGGARRAAPVLRRLAASAVLLLVVLRAPALPAETGQLDPAAVAALGLVAVDPPRPGERATHRVVDPTAFDALGVAGVARDDPAALAHLGGNRWRVLHVPSGVAFTLTLDPDLATLSFARGHGTTLWARFTDVTGLRPGTAVLLQGYEVGRVLRIELERPRADLREITFKVWLRITEGLPLPAGTTRIQIEQALPIQPPTLRVFQARGEETPGGGISHLGQVHVAEPERRPGIAVHLERAVAHIGDATVALPEGVQRLLGAIDQVASLIDALTASGGDVPRRVERILDNLERRLIAVSDTALADVEEAAKETRRLVVGLREVVGDVGALGVAEHPDELGRNTLAAFAFALNDVTRDVRDQVARLRAAGGVDLSARLGELDRLLRAGTDALRSLQQVAESARPLAEAIRPLVADGSGGGLRRSLANLEFVLERLATDTDVILGNLRATTWHLQELVRDLRRDPSAVIWGPPSRE